MGREMVVGAGRDTTTSGRRVGPFSGLSAAIIIKLFAPAAVLACH